MSASVLPDACLEEVQAIEQRLQRTLDMGVRDAPPRADVRYAAYAVCPQNEGNLLAFTIAHLDDDGFYLDVLRVDVPAAKADALARRYGTFLVTRQLDFATNSPLAQVLAACFRCCSRRHHITAPLGGT